MFVPLAMVLVLLLSVPSNAGGDETPSSVPVSRVIAALRGNGVSLDVHEKHASEAVTWLEAHYYDEEYPLTVSVVADSRIKPRRVLYMLTTSSLNFRGSFFTPVNEGLAFFMARHGYMVVGITPREDNVPLEADEGVMAEWGLEKHREDVRTIIRPIQRALGLPYDVLGHSFGAMVALDYAATTSDEAFGSVMLLDVPSLNPETQSDKMAAAAYSLDAYEGLMASGDYADSSIDDLRTLLFYASLYPDADSSMPRAVLIPGLPGTFTVSGLLHVSLIYTAYLPGAITEATGLPQEWPMLPPLDQWGTPRGNAAGWYAPAALPEGTDVALNDTFALRHIGLSQLVDLAVVLGSGWTPLALARDYTAVLANLDTYPIDWSGVDERVVWINGGLSMADQFEAATYIEREAGNTSVETYVIKDYGHMDVLLGEHAAEDVWVHLLP